MAPYSPLPKRNGNLEKQERKTLHPLFLDKMLLLE